MYPVVLEQIRDPELVTMQNKFLTIVFWDISGFSVLCERLQFHQELVVAFLREFFSEAVQLSTNMMVYWTSSWEME